jgi:hypothetical protein
MGGGNASLDLVRKRRTEMKLPIADAPVCLHARQDARQVCGYKNGDPASPRFAELGWYCALDTINNYWGVRNTVYASLNPANSACGSSALKASRLSRVAL